MEELMDIQDTLMDLLASHKWDILKMELLMENILTLKAWNALIYQVDLELNLVTVFTKAIT